MGTIAAALGCLGMLALSAAFVTLASTHGKWGFVALEGAGIAMILARIAAGRDRG